MKPPHENRHYEAVEKFAKRHFLCFKTAINKGRGSFSRPDIIGIREVGGDLSGDVETIIVEVKRGTGQFAKACGQTLSYNVYANRVYLAAAGSETFTPGELQTASHLGIGLIKILKTGCTEVLSSPYHTPIPRLNLELLENLAVAKCGLCNSFFETGNANNIFANVVREDVGKAILGEKGLMFWNYEVADRGERLRGLGGYGRRYICPGCIENLLTIQDKRLRSWLKEDGRDVLKEIIREEYTGFTTKT